MRSQILLTLLFIAANLFAQNSTVLSSPPHFGTFYLASEPGWPPLPCDPYPGLPVTVITNGIYLIDDRQVAAAKALLSSSGVESLEAPLPGDGGGTNGFHASGLQYTPPTNGFWLEMNGITNQEVYVTAHNVIADYFELLSKTNLADANWTMEQLFPINALDELPLSPVTEVNPDATNNQAFFWAKESDNLVGVASYGDAIRPSPDLPL